MIVLRYEDGDISHASRVVAMLKFVFPVACTYGEPLCDEVGA